GLNDDDEQLGGIARWIKESLGELTPWHVTRFHPDRQLSGVPATPMFTLKHARELAHNIGLKFVYLGNVGGAENDTVCYNCRQDAVQRPGFGARTTGVGEAGCCVN